MEKKRRILSTFYELVSIIAMLYDAITVMTLFLFLPVNLFLGKVGGMICLLLRALPALSRILN